MTTAERFWSQVDVGFPDECWEWAGYVNRDGYGRMMVDGKRQPIAHISLALDGRPVPDGMVAMHSCDNPPCVNPAHLSIGTQADNLADMRAKGRAVRPENPPLERCKRGHEFTPENTIDRSRYQNGRGRECRACRDLRNRNRRRDTAYALGQL